MLRCMIDWMGFHVVEPHCCAAFGCTGGLRARNEPAQLLLTVAHRQRPHRTTPVAAPSEADGNRRDQEAQKGGWGGVLFLRQRQQRRPNGQQLHRSILLLSTRSDVTAAGRVLRRATAARSGLPAFQNHLTQPPLINCCSRGLRRGQAPAAAVQLVRSPTAQTALV